MTRNLIAFTLAAATLAGAAAAQTPVSYFTLPSTIDSSSTLDLGTVRAADAGIIEIYDLNGTLLGTTDVHAGANANVRVQVGHPPLTDVRAELKIGGQTVAAQDYVISR